MVCGAYFSSIYESSRRRIPEERDLQLQIAPPRYEVGSMFLRNTVKNSYQTTRRYIREQRNFRLISWSHALLPPQNVMTTCVTHAVRRSPPTTHLA
jgi:hypothetical protein